jgi:hypothetical protein
MILVILAVMWAVVLGSQLLRNRADARPADSVAAFREQLAVIERTSPLGAGERAGGSAGIEAASRAAARRAPLRRRRRRIVCGLVVAMAGALVLGFVPALAFLHGVLVVVMALFAVYAVLLLRFRSSTSGAANVRYLPAPPAPSIEEGAPLLRRSGT